MKADWYNSKTLRVLTHIAVWAVTLTLPYLLDNHRGMHHDEAHVQIFFYLNLINNTLWIGPFYLNTYLLTPRLFSKGRYLLYGTALAAVFGIMLAIHVWLFNTVFALPYFSYAGAIRYLLPTFMLTIAIGTTYRIVRDKADADRLAQEKQEENLKTELSFLRSQINPHFIFNILNNLVALEQMKSEELGPTILKLSSLMQYMLYETDGDRVPLDNEIEYLQSYIDLQLQRFGTKVQVTTDMETPAQSFDIEPMLLIPFVENAFKHGVGMIDKPAIDIELQVKQNILHFTVRNRFNPLSAETKDKTSGIGLGNVRRRLKLLYGDNQQLEIQRGQDWFIVDLKLNLH